MTNATCAHCSEPMTGRKRKYCDRACQMKAYGARRIADGRLAAQIKKDAPRRAEWQKANRHRYDTLRTCEACRGEFVVARHLPTRTCSPGCDRVIRGGWSEPLPSDHWARMYGKYSWLPADHPARWYGKACSWPRTISCAWCGNAIQHRANHQLTCSARCKRRAKEARRRARRLGADGAYTWMEVVQLWDSIGRTCAYCDEPCSQFDPDHVVPLSRGGSNHLVNIVPACKPCNSDKRDLRLNEWYAERARKGKPPRSLNPMLTHLVLA